MSVSGQPKKAMRRHERKAIELPVTLSDSENRVRGGIVFDTRDMSVGGAFLCSDLLFEIGEELRVEFVTPAGRTVRARARVARVVRENGDGTVPGMGVEFVELSDEERDAVRAFLAKSG